MKNLGCPVVNVSDKAIEETAKFILDILKDEGFIDEQNSYILFDEGNSSMSDLLGGKGANLAEMTNIGLPVPYGFTISTEACKITMKKEKQISEE